MQLVYVCRKNKNLLFKKEGKNMSIIVNLDIMMARRKISLGELAEKVILLLPIFPFLKPVKPEPFVFLL